MKTLFTLLVAIPFFMVCANVNAQWTTLSFPSTQALDKAAFPDDNTGYVANSLYNKLWRTQNGGASWDSLTFTAFVNDVDFLSADTGFVLIGQGATSYSVKSTYNGGDTWTDHPIPGTGISYQTVYFTSKLVGYIIDYGANILRTADGGTTWTPAAIGSYAYSLDKEHINNDTLVFAGADGTFAYKGAIYRSYDAGATWQAVMHDSTYSTFLGSHFLNGMHGYTVHSSTWSTSESVLSKTLDGGNSWTEFYTDVNLVFQDVFMRTPIEGYITGITLTNTGEILKTLDGISWTTDHTTAYPVRKFFNNGNILWGIGDGGLVVKKNITVGIEESELDLTGKIYPNPTNGTVNFDFNETVELSLFDAAGSNVLSRNINSRQTIDMDQLQNGIYLARIVAGNKIGSFKIILSR